MQILKQGIDIEGFFRRVRGATRRLLMLDYDGTLAPFVVERDRAAPYPGVVDILDRIEERGKSRLVIVSGRAIADIGPLLGMASPPEIWGCHGWERRMADGSYIPPDLPAEALSGLSEAARWAAEAGFASNLEQKAAGVAVHLRGMAEAEARREFSRARHAWQPIAARSGLELREFSIGLEIKPPNRNKGHAVDALLCELGPETAAAYLGDDLTDEDAFASLGSRGLSVLVREEMRPTAADLWIRPPDELMGFLERWERSCGGCYER